MYIYIWFCHALPQQLEVRLSELQLLNMIAALGTWSDMACTCRCDMWQLSVRVYVVLCG